MSNIHDEELALKARSLARTFGKSTSLMSSREHAMRYYGTLRASARRVSNRYRELIALVARLKHITHEIESIFDNFFVVEAAIFELQNNVRKEDFVKLPLMMNEQRVFVPRLYYILSGLVRDTNQIIDKDILTAFLNEYQEHSPLSIRELYAIPPILQIVLVEHFGKLIDHSIESLHEYEDAERVYKNIKKEITKTSRYEFSKVTSDLASKYSIIPLSFGFYLFQKLSQEGSVMRPVIKWIKLNFEKQGVDSRELADLESKQRNANSVVASNSIESLHWLTQARWDDIVQEINVVDAILSKDPVGAYPLMDTESRNIYRRTIVRIAERAGIHEAEVARSAVRLCASSFGDSRKKEAHTEVRSHVGFYLLDKGRSELEHKIGYKQSWKDVLYNFFTHEPEKKYFSIALSLNMIMTSCAVGYMASFVAHPLLIALGGILFFFVNSEITLNILNVTINRFLPVRRLPRLDLTKGISDKQRTFVVIPSMLRSVEGVSEMVRKLEIRYLANPEDNIFYALLLDFKDAHSEVSELDTVLVDTVEKHIETLNKKYAVREKKFYFLYRKRVWNPSEGLFMGWERKRGKLREFNMLLCGKTGTTYVNESTFNHVPQIRYVITLDEDTELPKESARKLIGCIDHPLNKPVLSGDRVERGYGIIQPSVSVRLASATKSLFSRLYSSNSGIDSYSSAVSDVYQDLFGNALFFGKGIYDVQVVEKTMEGKIPDNRVLSHDLLEGIYARTGFASDIVFFDGFPKFYHEFIIRLHRWIRGDWQIVGWLMSPYTPRGASSATVGFSFVDRWKIADNLRRSLVPLVALCLIVYADFTDIPSLILNAYIVFALGSPFFVSLLNDVFSLKRVPTAIRFNDTLWQIRSTFVHVVLRLVFLLHQAFVSVSAISVTLTRLFVTHKYLLQWQNSTDVGQKLRGRLWEYYRAMWTTELISLSVILVFGSAEHFNMIVLWCVVWFLSPLVGFAVSISRTQKEVLNRSDARMLRSLAFRTAGYFLNFSQKENNWLIQDHFQELPKITEASRLATSPTNLGMLFASLYSSYAFGHLSLSSFIERTKKALVSLGKLERFKGHLYNWYDIERLEALLPKYVSSVDSANFLLALISTRQGVQKIKHTPLLEDTVFRGIEDGLCTLVEEIEILSKKDFSSKTLRKAIRVFDRAVRKAYAVSVKGSSSGDLHSMYAFLIHIHPFITDIEKALGAIKTHESVRGAEGVSGIAERVIALVEEHVSFIRHVAPYSTYHDQSIHSYASRDALLFKTYTAFSRVLGHVPTLTSLAYDFEHKVLSLDMKKSIADSSLSPEAKGHLFAWFEHTLREVKRAKNNAVAMLSDIEQIEREYSRYIDEADFAFLYNKERGLFHIGYNATFNRIDNACYNFLASESNSVSFVAILKNQVPQKHWFYLGRKLVRSGKDIALVSWGGSLFEYLTSLIFFKAHPESLLGKTGRSAIRVHQKHALKTGTVWGMGESAYRVFDTGKHYQYQVFGSSELGLKRGLADYLVVAPYTSALALPLKPHEASLNIRKLKAVGAMGSYGFYDALDYINQPDQKRVRPVPTHIYYAHHQGFTLLSLHNTLLSSTVQDLFHADPRVASLEVLFEEKMPRTPAAVPIATPVRLPFSTNLGTSDNGTESKVYVPVKTPTPRYAFISNGTYSAGVSNAGSGWSTYNGVSLSRFRDDPVLEEYGQFFYIKDHKTGTLWSPTTRPVGAMTRGQKVIFYENKAEFFASHGAIDSRLEVSVDPKKPVLVHTLTLSNKGSTPEHLTVASYGEVSLALQSQDVHHPQYQKLLVKSEYLPEYNALVYSRPHPQDRTKKIYYAHMLSRNSWKKVSVRACVDRESFIGRYGSLSRPAFLLSRTHAHIRDFTLDPIYSLSRSVEVRPGETCVLSFVNLAHDDKDELLKLIRQYRSSRESQRVVHQAITESALATKNQGVSQEMAVVFQELASRIFSGKDYMIDNVSPPSNLPYVHSLWRLGISGDYPVVVMVIKDIEDIQSVKHALICHNYWRRKGIEIDFVILNQEPTSYIKVLDDEIDFLMRQSRGEKVYDKGSSVHHVKSDLMTAEEKTILLHIARVVLDSKEGTFKQQVRARGEVFHEKATVRFSPSARIPVLQNKTIPALPSGLVHENNFGGFDERASEYVMHLSSDAMPPAPWANIITQENFGTLVTEAGATYTWSEDSYDNRITQWSNDPLLFKSAEIMYVRDEETGDTWNPTPLPIATKESFTVRHGKGYSIFEHRHSSLEQSYEVTVSLSDRVKISTLRLKNTGKKKRTLSVTFFAEPVMGAERNHTRDTLEFAYDSAGRMITFRNGFRNQLPTRVSAIDLYGGEFSYSTHRGEFLGRHGSYESPLGLKRVGLSNTIYKGTHNSVALQSMITIDPGEEKEITCLLAESDSVDTLRSVISSYRDSAKRKVEKEMVRDFWKKTLGVVSIETPDTSLNTLFNHQLLYQVLSSRIWAKTGFYQPSGAFGFRDQLQDITAFSWADPKRVRAFILKAAQHQFKEGDALNWWHDHNTFGIRTVLSDHQLWLPYAVSEYIKITGDVSLLDEKVAYIEGGSVNFSYQKEWAGTPQTSQEIETIFNHCVRALDKSLVFGTHGLPLMGMSDWNDGLSRVGIGGRGESVWVAWFLLYLLTLYIPYVERFGDKDRAEKYKNYSNHIQKSVEKNAWDGRWYRRAFLDSGIALGSRKLREFKVDSIAQSWSVLSGKARPERAVRAMKSAFSELFDGSNFKLLSPALETTQLDPGYVKDYPPGVRENGSQYNHATLWAAQALFAQGEADSAKKILDLVNPFLRSNSKEKVSEYRSEPYVVASDIYAEPSYKGRAGWSWYTGSAGVMYKTILQSLCGFNVIGDILTFKPSLPSGWTSTKITFVKNGTRFITTLEKPEGFSSNVKEVWLDSVKMESLQVPLVYDKRDHVIRVVLGS